MTVRPSEGCGEDIQALRDALAEREEEIRELRRRLLELQAEFDNYRKRIERERNALAEEEQDRVIRDFLPVYDSLERALETLERDGNAEGFVEGIRGILSQFREILARKGCEPFPALGRPFDPAYHEAVMVQAAEAEKNTVIAELERGWLRNGKVLRPAKVVVSLGPKGGDSDG